MTIDTTNMCSHLLPEGKEKQRLLTTTLNSSYECYTKDDEY